MSSYRILAGDCLHTLKTLPEKSAHCVVTSPPYYGLRDYGLPPTTWPKVKFAPMPGMRRMTIPAMECSLGLEPDPMAFIAHTVLVFREVRRVLRDDGTLWMNFGDSYASGGGTGAQGTRGQRYDRRHTQETLGSERKWPDLGIKPKDMMGIPWRVAFALQADGWFLRQDIIWHKPNPMPESIGDRCTKSHEYIFLLSKSQRYYFDADAIKEPVSGGAHPRAPLDSENPFAHNMDQHHENPGCRPGRNNGVGWGYTDGDNRKPRVTGKFPSGWKQGEGSHKAVDHMVSRSGNKERKPGAARGCPEDTGSHVNGSVPWEGTHRNKRSVWTATTAPFKGAHFATFPPALIVPCILAGSPRGGTVLDPFGGSGTTAGVANALGRDAILCELSPEYSKLPPRRVRDIRRDLEHLNQIPLLDERPIGAP